MENRTKFICITPIKNESWILEKFLTATSLWADYIILADQRSTDNSASIAAKFEKVILVKNENDYNEFERTKILLSEARKIQGRKIIFALDADEIFSANYMDSPEWDTIKNAPEGSVLMFDRINLTPDYDRHFGSLKMSLGFVDDGVTTIESTTKAILHNIRLPWPVDAISYYFKDIKVLHYDFVLPERTLSKLRWYQCFERIKFNQPDLYLLKKYPFFANIEDYLAQVKVSIVKDHWFKNYRDKNIDITSLNPPTLWWDEEVLKMIEKYGISFFQRLDIHTVDWERLAAKKGMASPPKYRLNRSLMDKIILRYWRKFSL